MTSQEEQINNAQVVIEHSHVVEAHSMAAVTLAFERQLSRLDVRLHKMRYTTASVMTTRPLAIKRVSQTIDCVRIIITTADQMEPS